MSTILRSCYVARCGGAAPADVRRPLVNLFLLLKRPDRGCTLLRGFLPTVLVFSIQASFFILTPCQTCSIEHVAQLSPMLSSQRLGDGYAGMILGEPIQSVRLLDCLPVVCIPHSRQIG